ncbi:hypothetical protein B0F90DRAFT_1838296 [Multifurca ochricompacta]|uniref:Peroxisomal biogenesis factor 11 n=1 Tax=Multifurca ochricompacta TaxID=376703 RepID=A0AAD4M5H3_9AGAM|nr:hypothetical protein B0F90DRAFT_1838296 [Multifurca ochricompacta]
MSVIAYPGQPSSSSHHDPLYPLSFDSASAGGFQMNPLSAHPPRTSRNSVITTSAMSFSSQGNNSKEDMEERPDDPEEELDDDDEGSQEKSAAKGQVHAQDVWRELLKTSVGRDKAFKLIQYSMKVYLFFHTAISRRMPVQGARKRGFEAELLHRLESAVSRLSVTRKCLIMFNWLTPLTSILAEHSASPVYTAGGAEAASPPHKPLLYTFLHASPPILLDLVQAIADDVSTCSKIGLLGKRTGERAGRFADWCWFASTLINLVENNVEHSMIINSQRAVESRLYAESMAGATAKSAPRNTKVDDRELKLLQRQSYWLQVQRTKLVMDLIFVSYEVFKWQRGREAIKALTGLASALLSSSKLYDRHRNSLVKTKTLSF